MNFEIKTKKEANMIVGGLGKPGKMPCLSWSISPEKCLTGSKLRKIEGSVCEKCYAIKGRYLFDNVKKALKRRLDKLSDPRWASAMIKLLEDQDYFRWFDSGDIQGVSHLKKIVEVCEGTPGCKHRLPTKEPYIVQKFLDEGNTIPQNLNIRISGQMIGKEPDFVPIIDGMRLSISTCSHKKIEGAFNCPATFNHDKTPTCEDAKCRACWDGKKYNHIHYKQH